jgi:hypothetical protein
MQRLVGALYASAVATSGCSNLLIEHPDMQHQSLKFPRRITRFPAVFFGAG